MTEKIMCVAGGTGGHIFPAVAFGKWLLKNEKGVSVDYMCGARKIEGDIYSSEGIDPFILDLTGSPLGTKVVRKIIKRTLCLFKEYFKVVSILRKEKTDYCILFGGYISFLPLIACLVTGIPVIVHEQNISAGKVTKICWMLKRTVLTGWEECFPLKSGNFIPVGIPVRPFFRLQDRDAWNILHIGLYYSGGPTVVVMAGSLGSKKIVELIKKTAGEIKFRSWNFIVLDDSRISEGNIPENVHFVGKQWNMNVVYSLADVAVVRAGASTLAELSVYRIPALVVPWIKSSKSHQVENARHFLKSSRGEIWAEDKDNLNEFICKLENLVNKKTDLNASNTDSELLHDRACENIWECISAL